MPDERTATPDSSLIPHLMGAIGKLSAPELLRLKGMLTFTLRDQLIRTAIFNQARNHVRGDYFEFGVWRGASLTLAYLTSEYARQFFGGLAASGRGEDFSSERFIGFDSFEGLPAPTGDDVGIYEAGDYAAPLEEVKRLLADAGVNLDRTVLIKGFFEDSLNEDTCARYKLGTASIVHIDVDYYASTKCVLDFIRHCITDGSILILDDWYLFRGDPQKGQRKAVGEWLAENPDIGLDEYMSSGWSKAFVVRRPPVA